MQLFLPEMGLVLKGVQRRPQCGNYWYNWRLNSYIVKRQTQLSRQIGIEIGLEIKFSTR